METVVVITRIGIGFTSPQDEEFGRLMLDKFLHSLETEENRPHWIIFYTQGAKVAAEGIGFELPLKLLRDLGVELLVCQTCFEHYGFKPEQVIGTLTGMHEIVRVLNKADKVLYA